MEFPEVTVVAAATRNFWEVYPEVKLIPQFNNLYTKDTSKKKKDSSDVMWAFALHTLPTSPFYKFPNKQELILQALKIKGNPFVNHKEELLIFEEMNLDEAEMAMEIWVTKMRERRKMLDELKYDPQDLDISLQIDKFWAQQAKLMDDYKKIKTQLDSMGGARSKSSKPKSGSDSGMI